ncbi:hypothetical protein B0J14DRAFT_602223 [Halenospora varia]|nr:hypothetical protein B0J14DRAFT_602223 [Halenospora varia]
MPIFDTVHILVGARSSRRPNKISSNQPKTITTSCSNNSNFLHFQGPRQLRIHFQTTTMAQSEEPRISRSVTLNFIGDWGQANFHRICSWITQEFCDRAGPRSRVGIWNVRGGGIEALHQVHDGEAQLCIATPAKLMKSALSGEGIFAASGPMPGLRCLATLPQRDRMMLAIDPKFGIRTFEELRQAKPSLRIATSSDDGTNFIGHVAMQMMAAHGIDQKTLESWGGSYVFTTRPEQAIANAADGKADAVLQEAIMTPWWAAVMEQRKFVPIPAEPEAVARLSDQPGFEPTSIRAGFWKGHDEEISVMDFSDFIVVVRDDMPEDIAFLLTWCIVETRKQIERQYAHLDPERSPLSYPLDPKKMAKTPLPLHPGAERYYNGAGHI